MTMEPLTGTEGQEFSIDAYDSWTTVFPGVGDILEVYMPGTDYLGAPAVWAAFLVVEADTPDLRSVTVKAKFLGSSNSELSKDLSLRFNRRTNYLHICAYRPCLSSEEHLGLHVTHLKWWSFDGFQADYYSAASRRQAKKWLAAARGEEVEPEVSRSQPKGAQPKSAATMAPPATGWEIPGEREPPPDEATEAADCLRQAAEALPPGKHEELRNRLAEVRAKIMPGLVAPPVDYAAALPAEAVQPEPSGVRDVFANARTAMNSGTLLGQAVPQRPAPKQAQGTSTPTTVDWKDPASALVGQAWALEKERKKKRKKKKHNASDSLAQVLKRVVLKKDKKKKKKHRPGGSGGSGDSPSSSPSRAGKKDGKKRKKRVTQPDGTILSYSTDSPSSSESLEESESSEIEAPMKKKSRKAPGSVLELLINHIQAQLYQGSTLDVTPRTNPMTSGVRVSTFFSLHVRPHYPQANREMREMYSLARAMDVLRSGDVPQTGDILAARFMALHQSLVDMNWVAAQHMELAPLEDAMATSPGLILATRKHSRLHQKVQGYDTGGAGYGKGRRRDWSGWSDNRPAGAPKGKGKQFKGGKGKGGDKGKKGSANSSNNPWAANLEKVEDKPPAK